MKGSQRYTNRLHKENMLSRQCGKRKQRLFEHLLPTLAVIVNETDSSETKMYQVFT